jgi:hypothetical protein
LKLSVVLDKKADLDFNLDLAKTEKAKAWIKIQETDFTKDREEVLTSLVEVKKHLLASKDAIKKTSLNSKEIIFFIRGFLTNIKN